MHPTLRAARARYSVDEREGARGPAAEQYAAARRWLACARDALRWSREAAAGAGEAVWLAKACEALVRAGEHRASARRWRPTRATRPTEAGVDHCSSCGALLDDDGACPTCSDDADPELCAIEAGFREEARARATIGAYYSAARHALSLVRIYQREPGTSGRRERDALAQVARYRAAIRELRRSLVAMDGSRPGLSKGGPPSSRDSQGRQGRQGRVAG